MRRVVLSMVRGASSVFGLGTNLSALAATGVAVDSARRVIERAQQGDAEAFDQLVIRAQIVWFRDEATAPLDGQRLLAFRQALRLKIAAERQPSWWTSWIRRLAAAMGEIPNRQAVAVAAAFALIVGTQVSRRPDTVVSQPLATSSTGLMMARSTTAHAPLMDDGLGDESHLRIEIQTQDPSVRIIWFGAPSP